MLVVELEKTKADNVQLYGKIRYVQDYSHEKIVSRGPKKVYIHPCRGNDIIYNFLAFDFCYIVLCSMQKILKVVLQMSRRSTRKCMRMT